VPADVFLVIDPLVSLSTAITARSWVWSLACAGAILLACVFIPRGFCGYLCPLGTLIDLFDWAIGRRVTRFQNPDDGWWVHIKYYVLLGTLVMALCGVLVSGFIAAIPVITRGLLMLLEPLQLFVMKDGHQIPPIGLGHIFSIVLFLSVLALGFLQPRFWCKYVCPSGAVFISWESLPSHQTESRVDLHQLQQVRRDLPVRRDQAGLHDEGYRLHSVPDMRPSLPDGGHQIHRPMGTGRSQNRKRPAHKRDSDRPAWLSVTRHRNNGSGRRRNRPGDGNSRLRRAIGRASGTAARQRARTAVLRHVHSLWRVFQGVPEQRPSGHGF